MVNLFDILVNDILSIFIDTQILNNKIGIANWSLTYFDIFKILFVLIASYIVVWLFMILPFRVLQRIMRYKQIKGGK